VSDPFTAHKAGRRAFEIKSYPWPVVTANSLRHVQDLGNVTKEDQNALTTPLLKGLVLASNVELQLKAALKEAIRRRDGQKDAESRLEAHKLVIRIEAQLARMQQVKEEWPLEVVG
jgi:hypothetical protein